MPYSLITLHEEMRLFQKILSFYSRQYPKIKFSRAERILRPDEIGEVLYTYAGGEAEQLAAEKAAEMERAIQFSPVPAIALQKGKKLILLDGHRRLRLAWKKRIPWRVLILVPGKNAKFAIEDSVISSIKDMY